ncbi:MAG: DUF805 domain-containing protein [Deltaproteobacteria bacterium]|nr:DUF805 domain-containing protein [Deltaproteobacteria bacterium]
MTGFIDLWRVSGRVNRRTFAIVGVVAMALKYNIDRIVAAVFERPWDPLQYWFPGLGATVLQLRPEDGAFAGAMLATAIPFIWLGTALTAKRLRDIGWPVWLVPVFFVPFVNLLFFVALCVAPSAATKTDADRPRWLRWLPESDLGSALMGAAVAPMALLPVGALGIYGLRQYGWGLFVGIPFAQGLFAVLLASVRRSRGLGECIAIAGGSALVTGAIIFFAAWEGILCIAMASPIAVTLAVLGGLVGWGMVCAGSAGSQSAAGAALAIFVALPALMGAEYQAGSRPVVLPVHTAIDIEAPPEVVWRHVIAFAELPPATETVFRLGIAYPTRARIEGTGVGAVRHCEFSTGAFVEPITVWDEPRRLEFDVVAQPRPMDEWSWRDHVDAPHLDDFLVSERGRFLLTPIPGGTRLTGTTWYRHNIWPEAYWRLWSDGIIHAIHRRVLGHIRNLALAEEPAS